VPFTDANGFAGAKGLGDGDRDAEGGFSGGMEARTALRGGGRTRGSVEDGGGGKLKVEPVGMTEDVDIIATGVRLEGSGVCDLEGGDEKVGPGLEALLNDAGACGERGLLLKDPMDASENEGMIDAGWVGNMLGPSERLVEMIRG
jgi:hypothetical protein